MKISTFTSTDAAIKSGGVKIPTSAHWKTHEERYEKIKKKIKSTLFRMTGYDGYLLYVEIPSSVEGHFYQVVLQVYAKFGTNKLEDYHLKIFSNCPSFVYNYAYVYYNLVDPETSTQNLIVTDLHAKIMKKDSGGQMIVPKMEDYMGEEAISDFPDIKNPSGLPLLDYSVACAILHFIRSYRPHELMSAASPITPKRFFDRIYTLDEMKVKRESHKIKNDAAKVKDQLKDTPKRVQKAAVNAVKQGDVVRVTKGHVIKGRPSTNVNHIRAASGFRAKPGMKTTRKSK